MSRKVFKYILNPYELDKDSRLNLELPMGSVVLSVAEQRGKMVLYALVDDSETAKENNIIYIHGTGHNTEVSHFSRFLGTVKLEDGALMFHIFWRRDN